MNRWLAILGLVLGLVAGSDRPASVDSPVYEPHTVISLDPTLCPGRRDYVLLGQPIGCMSG